MSWQTLTLHEAREVHVLPLADAKPHSETRRCHCMPVVEHSPGDWGTLIVHYSFDGREEFENALHARAAQGIRDA